MTANRPADGPADAGGLKRVLGRYDVTMIVMGSIIGAGVFRAPAGIARDMGSLGGVLAVWGFGGLVAFSGALVFAELGGMMPHTGGEYVFIRAGAGRFAAFLFGWISLTAIVSSAIGFVAGVFVEHLEALLRYGSPDLAFGSGSKRALAAALIFASIETFWTLAPRRMPRALSAASATISAAASARFEPDPKARSGLP